MRREEVVKNYMLEMGEDLHLRVKMLAVECSQTMNSILVHAIEIGIEQLEEEIGGGE